MKRVPAMFYRTEGGNEPVRSLLLDLDKDDRRKVGEDIKLVEFGWPIGMPTCRPMGNGIHEIRTDISEGRTVRIFFYIDAKQRMVLLSGLIKKTRKTPGVEMELALSNKRRHQRGLS